MTRLRIVAVMNDRMDRLRFVSAALVIPLLVDFAFGITAVASPLGDVVMLCTVASLVLGFVAILRVRKSNSNRRSSLVLAVFPFAVVLVTLLIDFI